VVILTRIAATGLAALVAGYLVGGTLVSALFGLLPEQVYRAVGDLIMLLCAWPVGRFVWRRTSSLRPSLDVFAAGGALVVGGIGLVGGFVGPLIFSPGANQGPLLGIIVTGPLGAFLGAAGGVIYWKVRGQKIAQR
jgi:hypothetical protein